MEWVEVAGKTVEDAIAAGLDELGIADRDQAVIEVLQEPKSGFLGIGSQLAHVKVTPKPASTRKRRRRRRKPRTEGADRQAAAGSKASNGGQGGGGSKQAGTGQRTAKGTSGQQSGSKTRSGKAKTPAKPAGSPQQGRQQRNDTAKKDKQKQQSGRRGGGSQRTQDREKAASMTEEREGRPEATIEERATVAAAFVEGLLDAFGLEGNVATEIDEDILKIDVSGDQTEALVGPKGSVMQSVLEITRTVVQRKTYGAPRMRLDIAGYAERRREALKIYAGKLAEKVVSDGGEIMLEPMNPADRKVIHDAVAEIDGVQSFSEGEDPDRAVVLAPE